MSKINSTLGIFNKRKISNKPASPMQRVFMGKDEINDLISSCYCHKKGNDQLPLLQNDEQEYLEDALEQNIKQQLEQEELGHMKEGTFFNRNEIQQAASIYPNNFHQDDINILWRPHRLF